MDFYYVDPDELDGGGEEYFHELITRRIQDADDFPADVSLPRLSWMYFDWLIQECGYPHDWILQYAADAWPKEPLNEGLKNAVHTMYVHRYIRGASQPEWCAESVYDVKELSEEQYNSFAAAPLPDDDVLEEEPLERPAANLVITSPLPWVKKSKK